MMPFEQLTCFCKGFRMFLIFLNSLEQNILKAAAATSMNISYPQDTKQLGLNNVGVASIILPKISSTHRNIVYLSAKSYIVRKSCEILKVFGAINLLHKPSTQGLVYRAITSVSDPTKVNNISSTMILSSGKAKSLQKISRPFLTESFCIVY